jgi:phenylalanine-4-hydroxylase
MFIRKYAHSLFSLRKYSDNLSIISLSVTNLNPNDLSDTLDKLAQNKLILTNIKPKSSSDLNKTFEIHLETRDEASLRSLFPILQNKGISVDKFESKKIVWFPRDLKELDSIRAKTSTSGSLEVPADHPAAHDEVYKKRRSEIGEIARNHSIFEKKVPKVQYTIKEIETWQKIFDNLTPLHKKHACKEHNDSFEDIKKNCGFQRNNIPQIDDINDYIRDKTGFKLIPITGFLDLKEFFIYLAFKFFSCTQYIRHDSTPFYTPEPDLVHELMGHIPLLANPEFADFSQQLGLASLGASDSDIKKLFACYWFSIETGLVKENNQNKVYGAAALSSVNEILNAMSTEKIRHFDPFEVCELEFPFSSLQSFYCSANSLAEVRQMMQKYLESISGGFKTSYDAKNQRIKIDLIPS